MFTYLVPIFSNAILRLIFFLCLRILKMRRIPKDVLRGLAGLIEAARGPATMNTALNKWWRVTTTVYIYIFYEFAIPLLCTQAHRELHRRTLYTICCALLEICLLIFSTVERTILQTHRENCNSFVPN